MSEESNPKKKSPEPGENNTNKALSEEERRQLIEKIKANLFLEDQESVQLYASLIKVSIT